MKLKYRLLVAVTFLLVLIFVTQSRADEALQVLVSATPVPIDLPSPLPFVTQAVIATEAPTGTPTPPGPVLLEALTEANVRAQPDTGAEKLGTIRAGSTYAIIGRYFRWFQFQYDQAPDGVGWVFDELVKIIGDESTIRDLTQDALPTIDPVIVAVTGTLGVITQTPGGILTATAQAGAISLPVQSDTTNGQPSVVPPGNPVLLPTFTFPADVPLLQQPGALDATPTLENEGLNVTLPNRIPPIAPILVLGVLGVLGLFISSYRR